MAVTMNLDDRPIALLLIAVDERGEREWWIVHGTIRRGADSVFVRSRDGATLPMEEGSTELVR